jgi:GNAT superfamily N-acetyltransferase
MPPVQTHTLSLPASDADIDALATLLVDAVDSGASVSFMAGLTLSEAREWWSRTLASLPERGAVIVARDTEGICGCVLLQPAWPPNQPHRADVAKLLVHRRARRRGIGDALMNAVETYARAAGFSLLVLDTVPGLEGYRLYQRRGWTEAGVIPNYALFPGGRPCDTAVFYLPL